MHLAAFLAGLPLMVWLGVVPGEHPDTARGEVQWPHSTASKHMGFLGCYVAAFLCFTQQLECSMALRLPWLCISTTYTLHQAPPKHKQMTVCACFLHSSSIVSSMLYAAHNTLQPAFSMYIWHRVQVGGGCKYNDKDKGSLSYYLDGSFL